MIRIFKFNNNNEAAEFVGVIIIGIFGKQDIPLAGSQKKSIGANGPDGTKKHHHK